jgi:hypothetical protein
MLGAPPTPCAPLTPRTHASSSQLDSVASAMRAGGRAVKAAKRAVEDASREARKTAQAAAGGKDAKSILKSIILR